MTSTLHGPMIGCPEGYWRKLSRWWVSRPRFSIEKPEGLKFISMALRIEPGTAGDAEDIADVHLRAMEDNLLLHAQFPNPESLAFLRNWLAKDTVEHTQDLGKGVLVARDEASGEIASFVKWLVHRPAEQDSSEPAQEEQWPESCRVKYLDSYSALTQRVRDSVMGDKPFFREFNSPSRPVLNG